MIVSWLFSSCHKIDCPRNRAASFGRTFQAADTLVVTDDVFLTDLDVHWTGDIADSIQIARAFMTPDPEDPE
jgi:hypothetical protein